MKKALLLSLMGLSLIQTPLTFPSGSLHAAAQDKEVKKKDRGNKNKKKESKIKKGQQFRIGGKSYQQSTIALSKEMITARHQGASYHVSLDQKGVIHFNLVINGKIERKSAVIAEILWRDHKNKNANDVALTSLNVEEVSDVVWKFTGSFKTIKGSFEMLMSFHEQSIDLQCDASCSKSGELKVSFITTNLTALYKKDMKKTDAAAEKSIFSGILKKKKAFKSIYSKGKLKSISPLSFQQIKLTEHFNLPISYSAPSAEGSLNIKAYSGGVWLKDGFNIRYRTSSQGKINLGKNKLTMTFGE